MTGMRPRLPARALGPLLRRPFLWPTAVRQAVVLAPDGWWRTPPHLPLPSADYLRFRLITAFGGDGSLDDVDPSDLGADLVTYLEWCRTRPLG